MRLRNYELKFTVNVCTNNSMYYVVNKTIVNKLKYYKSDYSLDSIEKNHII